MADLLKVSILGAMPGGEVWSINPTFSLPLGTDLNYDELMTIAQAVNGVAVPAGLHSLMAVQNTVSGCRVEARTFSGELEAVAEATRAAVVNGSGPSALPYQASVCISLATAVPGGRTRGRLYWPATGVGLDIYTLRMSAGTRAGALAGAKTYLEGIQSAVSASLAGSSLLVVWSRTGESIQLVNKLRVGDVIDTQRRRRDALAETTSSVDFGIV